MLKNYWKFTSNFYKIISFIIIPAVLIIILLIPYDEVRITLVSGILWMYEILTDDLSVGSICFKEGRHLEYVKTSTKSRKMVRDVIYMDSIRRVMYFIIFMGIIGYITNYSIFAENNTWVNVIGYIGMEYDAAMLGIVIGRVLANKSAAYLAGGTAQAICLLVSVIVGSIFLMFVWLIIGIAITVFTIYYVNRKMRDSYYD